MKKSDLTRRYILEYIEKNPGSSSTEVARFLEITPVTVFNHTKELLIQEMIEVQGKSRNTRYFRKENLHIPFDLINILENAKVEISEAYDGLEDISLRTFLDSLLLILLPNGIWRKGIDALYEMIKKENNGNIPNEKLFEERLIAFLFSYLDEERKRRKNGLFDGTESLKLILKENNEEYFIDKLYFHELSRLGHWGKLRTASELYYGKQQQDIKLLTDALRTTIDSLQTFFIKESVDVVIYTPPTLPREVQFRDVLKSEFGKAIFEIRAEKVTHKTFRPQKELKGKDRFINAKESIKLEIPKSFDNLHHIVIFDDNFTTGATVNAIGEKLREAGYKEKISVITITGNFEYIAGVTDDEEI